MMARDDFNKPEGWKGTNYDELLRHREGVVARNNKLANKYLDLHKEFGSLDIDALQTSFKKGGENYVKYGGKRAKQVQDYINFIKLGGRNELDGLIKPQVPQPTPTAAPSVTQAERMLKAKRAVQLKSREAMANLPRSAQQVTTVAARRPIVQRITPYIKRFR